MKQITLDGIIYNIYAKGEDPNPAHKHESIIVATTGEYPAIDEKEIVVKFLNANGGNFKNTDMTTHHFIRELLKVLNNPAAKTVLNTDIDFLFTMNYIEKYANKPYEDINNSLTQTRKDELNDIKDNGQKAVNEVAKMACVLSTRFGLSSKGSSNKWLDGSNKKVRDYLWLQMQYDNYKSTTDSISIFVDKSDPNNPTMSKPRIRFSIEMQDAKATPAAYDTHHKFLDMPLKPGLCYIVDSNQLHDVVILNESADMVKAKIANGTYKKVQLSKVIEYDPSLTNDQIYNEMVQGVSDLIPYYDLVIGKTTTTNSGSASKISNSIKEATTMNDKIGLNTILYGPPGTGKTYNSKIYADAICSKKKLSDYDSIPYDDIKKEYDSLYSAGRITFTTFHQSYGYEEFIEGIKPESKNGVIEYPVKSGCFKAFCEKAATDPDNNYVFIIDEINRGNISKIFGELITLIEESKRGGAKEEMSATLPYSGSKFSVPKNVYILGTMNTADRSISLMDTALRRRFDFIEMMPKPSIVNKTVAGVDIENMLKTINDRITVLYDREHTIGHAFFTGLESNSTIDDLASIFKNKVIPLLQEYFYEDYSKIRLVLGDNGKANDQYQFIHEIDNSTKNVFKGNYDPDLVENFSYEINNDALKEPESYIQIYK